MQIPIRILTLLVLLADFVLVGVVFPPLFILTMGSARAAPGRYRGALRSSVRLAAPLLTGLVRLKALYAVLLATVVALGLVRLPWWATAPVVALLLSWEVGLETSQALDRFLRGRCGGLSLRLIRTRGVPTDLQAEADPKAKRLLLAGAGFLVAEMLLLTYLVTRLFFVAV